MTGSLCVATADARKNYISLINDYCQKKGFSHSFVLDKKYGPSHAPQWVWLTAREILSTDLGVESKPSGVHVSHRFYYKLLINGQEYSVGEGKTAKDAKQKAAQLAWSPLQVYTLTYFIYNAVIFGWCIPFMFHLISLHSHLPNTPSAFDNDPFTHSLLTSCQCLDKLFFFVLLVRCIWRRASRGVHAQKRHVRPRHRICWSRLPFISCIYLYVLQAASVRWDQTLHQFPSIMGSDLPGRRLLSRIRSSQPEAANASAHSTHVKLM